MAVKISVVVPVYNPGSYIEACIASVLNQSMPADEYEVVFVDDGSTDDTPERLDRLAAEHPNVTVIHTPNSGWPGRPRNVGIEASVGRYVYFVDNDDWIGEEALARLWETAERNGADVVVGREVGHGKGVPRHLFRANVDDATLQNAPLLDLLTPHKLFRRSLLDEHGIRFPEGRRRFEDHLFVMKTYFTARRISILADYPCYHWLKREDWGNASDRYAEPRSYYDNLREVLDLIERHTEPGPFRDRLFAHWYRWRVLERFRGDSWADGPSAHGREVYEEARSLALERFGPSVDAWLPLKFRIRSHSLRAGRVDLLVAQARVEHGMTAEVILASCERTATHLRLGLTVDLVDGQGEPVRFVRRDGAIAWQAPGELAAEEPLDASRDLEEAQLEVVLRHRETGLEVDVMGSIERVLADDGAGLRLSVRGSADVDLARAALGAEMEPGLWDLFVEVTCCGWRSLRRLADVQATLHRPVRVHTTKFGNLSLKVEARVDDSPPPARPPRPARPIRPPTAWIPRAVLRAIPVPAREAGKRVLLRLGWRRR